MVNLYPNPCNHGFNLEWKEKFTASTVKVYDVNGKLVMQVEWNNDKTLTLNVDNLPNCIYFVNIETGKEKMTRKLIILK